MMVANHFNTQNKRGNASSSRQTNLLDPVLKMFPV